MQLQRFLQFAMLCSVAPCWHVDSGLRAASKAPLYIYLCSCHGSTMCLWCSRLCACVGQGLCASCNTFHCLHLLCCSTYLQDDLKLGKLLGSGGFGSVYKATLTEEDGSTKNVIVKKVGGGACLLRQWVAGYGGRFFAIQL